MSTLRPRATLERVLPFLPASLLVAAGWSRRWVDEDAFIAFRVAGNLAAGHGPVFNVGERVEVATSTLWTLLLALASRTSVALGGGGSVEWPAVLLGLASTGIGLTLATRAAQAFATARGRFVVPVGALSIAAMPAYWDYATSGLETGLAFGWLGLALHGVARGSRWLPLAASIGPLVRPELGLSALGFFLTHAVVVPPIGKREVWRRLAAIAALPAALSFFRAGYFACLVPNTALAKEAFLADWTRGWEYLADFASAYFLAIPFLLLAGLHWTYVASTRQTGEGRLALARAFLVATALVQGLYVVRLGGDAMHARLLLPAWLLFAAPVVVDFGSSRRRQQIAAGAILGWSVICAATLRPPYTLWSDERRVNDERAFYIHLTGRDAPVAYRDFRQTRWVTSGERTRTRAVEERGVYSVDEETGETRVYRLGPERTRSVVLSGGIGLFGVAVGTDVHLTDRYGLADPIGARFELRQRGWAGHDKWVDEAWIVGRWGDPSEASGLRADATRAALQTPALRELVDAVTAPLDVPRFLANLRASLRLTLLRIPPDPFDAREKLSRP